MTTYTFPLPVHPAAEKFPLLGEEELEKLTEDIRVNGLIEPVWLWEDTEHGTVLLDGRNRVLCCQRAGVPWDDPAPRYYRGTDPIGFAVSENVRRRHLSAGQRAMIALDIEQLLSAQARSAVIAKRKDAAEQRWTRQKKVEDTLRELSARKVPLPLKGGDLQVFEDSRDFHAANVASRQLQRLKQRVYFIGDEEQHRIKIGISENPDGRLEILRRGDPHLYILGETTGGSDVEHALHRRLAEYRIAGEWFRWCPEVEYVLNEVVHLSINGQMHPDEIDTLGAAAQMVHVSRTYVGYAKRIGREPVFSKLPRQLP